MSLRTLILMHSSWLHRTVICRYVSKPPSVQLRIWQGMTSRHTAQSEVHDTAGDPGSFLNWCFSLCRVSWERDLRG